MVVPSNIDSCDSQEGHPLQYAQFSLACFEFNCGPSKCGSIGYYRSYNHSVYPIHHPWKYTASHVHEIMST
jgi:hypothetical protein